MIVVDPDDMEYCEGTKQQAHPGVWFYRPEQEQFTEDGFHLERVRSGHCPVCVVIQHVVPVMPHVVPVIHHVVPLMQVQSLSSDECKSKDYGHLEVRR